MVRVILLGAGRAGRFHAETLRRSAAFRAVCVVDRELERAEFLARTLDCAAEADPDRAFEAHPADAVLVATTTHTHTTLVRQALNRHLHVFCEKPLGNLPEIRECYRIAREANRTLMVGFQRRFDPEFNALRDRLGDRTPQLLKLTSRDSPIPSQGYLATSGGIVKDCAVHDIDVANWMMGGSATHRIPVRAFAASYTHHPDLKAWAEIEGLAVTMQYSDGALALIDVSRTCGYGYDQRVEAFGPFGMLQVENRRGSTLVEHSTDGTTRANPLYSFPQRYADAYRLELEHFADVIMGSASCRILESQVVATEVVCETIERSLDTGLPQEVWD